MLEQPNNSAKHKFKKQLAHLNEDTLGPILLPFFFSKYLFFSCMQAKSCSEEAAFHLENPGVFIGVYIMSRNFEL